MSKLLIKSHIMDLLISKHHQTRGINQKTVGNHLYHETTFNKKATRFRSLSEAALMKKSLCIWKRESKILRRSGRMLHWPKKTLPIPRKTTK